MRAINDEILLIVKNEVDKQLVSSKCIITRNYSDGYVDVNNTYMKVEVDNV